MQVFVAGAVGLLGVVLVIAGVQSHGSALFTALTGQGVPAGSTRPAGASSASSAAGWATAHAVGLGAAAAAHPAIPGVTK
jgi:hypothetical protein